MGVRDTHIVRAIDAAVERRLKREHRSSGLTTVIQGANDAVTPPSEVAEFSSIDAVISETEPDTADYEDGDIWIEIVIDETTGTSIVGIHFLIDGEWFEMPGGADAFTVMTSGSDPTADYLLAKLQAGSAIAIVEVPDGGGNTVLISLQVASQDANDLLVAINSTTWGRLAVGAAGKVLKVAAGGGSLEWGADNDTPPITNHGDLDGLSDDDHTQYAKLLGRATGQQIYGGTGAAEQLLLDGTDDGDGDIVANGSFTIDPNGAHKNNYNGVAVAVVSVGVVPDSLIVTFAAELPDTDYSLQLTPYWQTYELDPQKVIADPGGMLIVTNISVHTSWCIVSKSTTGFQAIPIYTVINPSTTFEPQIGNFSIAPHHGNHIKSLEAYWGFTADALQYTADWAVRRF